MDERTSIGEASAEEALSDYAAEWVGKTGYLPEDLDWVYLPTLPCNLFWDRPEAVRRWWREEMREARKHGGADAWEALLHEPVENPVVVGVYGVDDFEIWDGNHRIAASAINGAGCVPAVVDVLKGLAPGEFPKAVREALIHAFDRDVCPSVPR